MRKLLGHRAYQHHHAAQPSELLKRDDCLAQRVADELLHALKAAHLLAKRSCLPPAVQAHRNLALIHTHQRWLAVSFLSSLTSSALIIQQLAAPCLLAACWYHSPFIPTHALALAIWQVGIRTAKSRTQATDRLLSLVGSIVA